MVVVNNNNYEDQRSQIWSNEDIGLEINDDGGVEMEVVDHIGFEINDDGIEMEVVDRNYCQKQSQSSASEIPKMKMYEEKYVKDLVSEFIIK